jgi:putative addiction module component (TIGR02574 family)
MNGDMKPRIPDDLSVPEKILLVQDLWDDIARSSHEIELTTAQVEEAERRLREYQAHPGDTVSWEDLKRRLGGGR